jgi:hypothetical protein
LKLNLIKGMKPDREIYGVGSSMKLSKKICCLKTIQYLYENKFIDENFRSILKGQDEMESKKKRIDKMKIYEIYKINKGFSR